ncbi:MAG: hypothetical protein KME03_04800 [Aphanocapsa lilacina HA4352-LM1]|jgi:arsenical pump membrane protein|nr:hypothetical protein [Aphanocapsa lilacina HA4352-LM1]
MQSVLAALLFVGVMVPVLRPPWGLPIAVPAVAGAVLAVALGLADFSDVVQVLALTWNAVFTLVGLVLFSAALEANGFFRWAALHVVRLAGGDGRALLGWLAVLTALVAAVLANDGAVLILTPLVWQLSEQLQLRPASRWAYLFAVGFLCDAASTPLAISNLTNILFADTFGLGFVEFARTMALPTLGGLAAAIAALLVLFRRPLGIRYQPHDTPPSASAIRSYPAFVVGWLALGALSVGCAFASFAAVPVTVIVLPLSLLLLAHARALKLLALGHVLRTAPWGILFFAVGLFVVVLGLFTSGTLAGVQALLVDLARTGNLVGVGAVVGALSALLNNLPAALFGILSLQSMPLDPVSTHAAVYAQILGTNIGCKLTPTGSLSTLLWLALLRERGLVISWQTYALTSLPVTLAALFGALVALQWG